MIQPSKFKLRRMITEDFFSKLESLMDEGVFFLNPINSDFENSDEEPEDPELKVDQKVSIKEIK